MNRREFLLKTGAAGVLAMLQMRMLQPAFAAMDEVSEKGRIDISVKRHQGDGYPVFEVQARVAVGAAVARVWQVLTDYDRLAEFVPDLASSQLLSREGDQGEVAQEGTARFWFIRQPVHLLMHVQETPFSHIALTLVRGNMHEYHADWQLNALEQTATDPPAPQTEIVYTGTIAPAFYVPSLFGAALMKSDLRNMMAAVVRRIEKDA